MNELLEFRNEILTGIENIDNQHKDLFKILNILFNYSLKGELTNEITITLNELTTYVDNHFTDEEKMMIDYSFPNIEEHILEHKKLKEKVNSLLLNIDKQGVSSEIIRETNRLAIEWLISHLYSMDIELAEYIKTNKIQL